MQTKPLWKSLYEDVMSLFQSNDNSKVMPGKKDVCKGKDGKKHQMKFPQLLNQESASQVSYRESREMAHFILGI